MIMIVMMIVMIMIVMMIVVMIVMDNSNNNNNSSTSHGISITVILKLIRRRASSLVSMTTLDTMVVDKNAVNSAMNSISIKVRAIIDTLCNNVS